ncbi:MAG: ABC transporter ATP-binding protein [Armatimonadota bacterium]|nr:ABC transporter ATP-binding protein [Armatimonadota bacterium]MDR7455337.1 ABC transporter ATP-binding protein [Armatimonadota bacterium]MDR7455758.1 ABC transporter ATP-binding protein [Armatimonadota bacterium]MDR7496458.1 ABC transporter ATP-binding protein [Armatimonadota bacterium]MDR7511966.1 ABC transporter ATP-binding protein [Armatimonadota bacterium]
MSTFFQEDEIAGRAYDPRLMRRLLGYVRPYRPQVALAVVLLLLTSGAGLAGPYLVRIAIDRHIAPARLEGLGLVVAAYVGALVAAFLFRYGQSYVMQWVGHRVTTTLRVELFHHLQRLSVAFYTRQPVGRLVTRVTNDIDALNEMITQGVVAIFGDLFTLVLIVGIMLSMDWRLALATMAVLPAIAVATARFSTRARASYRAVRVRLARLNAFLNEHIMGMGVVQLFGREAREFTRFDALNRDHLAASLGALRSFATFMPAVGVASAVAVAIIIGYGGLQALRGAVSVGLVVAFIQYAQRFFEPIEDLAEKYNILQAAMASSERIFRILDEPVEVADPPDPVRAARVRGEIEFRDVWFAYDADDWVLRGVSFRIAPGESVALVGHTGAGKSSIINLIMRFHDPQRGQVLVDGVDVRRWDQRDLRRHIGLVLQDVFLFSGTVEDNIRLGTPGITDAQVRRAAEFVNAHAFVERLANGYRTVVHERGATLSVGQKQLVAFARAIAHNPDVLLVLDEATSSVDTETEMLIQEALRRVMRGRTSLIIAHRLSTIQHVDRILVIHRGRLVEEGTHRELLARGGVYTTLYQLQYRDQERRPAAGTVAGGGGEGRRGG